MEAVARSAAIARAVDILRADNPAAPLSDVIQYAEAFADHRAAAANVTANGSVVAHPKTGAPIKNPCSAVVADRARVMASLKRLKRTDRLWAQG